MSEILYKVSELRAMIKESSSLSIVNKYNKDNLKNANDFYKEASKNVENGNDKIKKEPKLDDNKTTLDYSFDYEPDKSYKDRVKAQVNGYTSVQEEENDIEKAGEFDKNKEIYDTLKDAHNTRAKNTLLGKKSGLTAKKLPNSTFEKDSMFENNNFKTLNFKHTKFLNEKHMLSRIPEEFKKNGCKFIMKDSIGNEYIVEWSVNKTNNISEGNVIAFRNKKVISEEMNRIKNLMNYNSNDFYKNTTSSFRVFENENVGKFIDEVKKIKE